MGAITNNTKLATVLRFEEDRSYSDSKRLVQNSLLSELPGLAFAIIALAYIVTSLVGYAAIAM